MKTRSIYKALLLIATGLILNYSSASAQMTTVGMDHVGFGVPDLNQAVTFFTDVMGFHKIYEEGKLPLDANGKKAFNIRPNGEITHIVMMSTGFGSNIEIFEFNSPDRDMKRPLTDDVGWYHIAFYTNDMNKTVAHLKAKGVEFIGSPIIHKEGPNGGLTGVYFKTPWGLQIELVSYPKGLDYEKTHPKYKLWSPRNYEKN